MLKKKAMTLMAGAIILPLALTTYSAAVSANNVEFKATIKAVCSLSVASLVDLGEVPITAFSGKNAGEEIEGYNKTFVIETSCAGTDKYALTFTPVKASGGCLESSSEEMAFCLYDAASTKINLLAAGTRLEKETGAGSQNIKVVPARATKAPTAGDHSGTLTVTIAPL